jgi:predicted nuclease of predicted toxin-antitoxin system
MIHLSFTPHQLYSDCGPELSQSNNNDPRPLWRPADYSWHADQGHRHFGPLGSRSGPGGDSGRLSLSGRRGHHSGAGIQFSPDVSPRARGGVTPFLFIVDENLPQHLAYWLRDNGQTATHVELEGLGQGADASIWKWAGERNAIVISKDEDFHNRVVIGTPPRLVWIRWGNVRKKPLIEKFERILQEVLLALEEGEWELELIDS